VGSSLTLPELVARLVVSAESLGALAAVAELRVSGERAPPELARTLGAVVAALEAGEALEGASAAQLTAIAGIARTLLGQALELAREPARAPGWQVTEPAILEGSGQASIAFAATLNAMILPRLSGLELRFGAQGAAFLDVGVGTGHLPIALCESWPALSAVGVDPWAPALERARANVAAANLSHRVTLRLQGVEDLEDAEAYDLVWLPASFIPEAALRAGLPRVTRALRPGGWLLLGHFAGRDALSAALADVRTLRSGGALLTDEALGVLLAEAGLAQVTSLPRSSLGLLAVLAARRPEGEPVGVLTSRSEADR
jgi:SAM-dependent methyltransferase